MSGVACAVRRRKDPSACDSRHCGLDAEGSSRFYRRVTPTPQNHAELHWFVCAATRGVLRRATTRADALMWMFECYDVERVEISWKYAPGLYEYIVHNGHEFAGLFVVRADQMNRTGFKATQKPLYPNDSNPYVEVPRD